MRTVVCLGGIGADSRIFSYLNSPLLDFRFVEWIHPNRGESLPNYVKRLADQMTFTDAPILLGVSFGGIVALELSRFLKPATTILVSSVRKPAEIPWYFRLARRTGVQNTSALRYLLRSEFIASYLFGVTNANHRRLLHDMITDTSDEFKNWAVKQFLQWQGCCPVGRVFHIHGTSDRILPARFVAADVLIDGGSHFMIVTQGDQVSAAIADLLA